MIKLTEEQREIVEALGKSDSLKINAFAGTGKTTTLKELTLAYPDMKFLYLAFNRSIAQEAKRKFPRNTDIYTTHGLAYRMTKRELNMKNLRNSDYRPRELMDILGMPDWRIADLVLSFFNGYCHSDLKEVSPDSMRKLRKKDTQLSLKFKLLEEEYKDLTNEFIAEHVNKLWNGMIDGEIGMTHNLYLKYFHLNLKRYSVYLSKYDVVLLDEAQDTNEVTLDIVNSLPVRKRVIVGDTHQQIYGFRKSVNAMNKFKADTTLYLSISFRITSQVAQRASRLLHLLKGEGKPITATKEEDPTKDVREGTYAIITRTNAQLIRELNWKVKEGEEDELTTVRPPSDIFRLPLSVYYFQLYCDTRDRSLLSLVQEKWMLNFDTFQELEEYAEGIDDVELLSAIKIVKEKEINLPSLYDIAVRLYGNPRARVYLTTAHTAKGLEWDTVKLTEDFPELTKKIASTLIRVLGEKKAGRIKAPLRSFKELLGKENTYAVSTGEEVNLYYVAMTRAKNRLIDLTQNEWICTAEEAEVNEQIIEDIRSILKKSSAQNKTHSLL